MLTEPTAETDWTRLEWDECQSRIGEDSKAIYLVLTDVRRRMFARIHEARC